MVRMLAYTALLYQRLIADGALSDDLERLPALLGTLIGLLGNGRTMIWRRRSVPGWGRFCWRRFRGRVPEPLLRLE